MLTTTTSYTAPAQGLPEDRFLRQLDLQQLDWVQASGNYLTLRIGSRTYKHKISLCRMEQLLPKDRFIRTHKSCLVQIHKIEKVDLAKNEVSVCGHVLPLGRTYREGLLSRLPVLG